MEPLKDERGETYQTGSGWDNEQHRWTSDATAPEEDSNQPPHHDTLLHSEEFSYK